MYENEDDFEDEHDVIDSMMEWEEECNYEPMVEPNVTIDDMREWM